MKNGLALCSLIGGLVLSILGGCGLIASEREAPSFTEEENLPDFAHPMNLEWTSDRDFFYLKFGNYMDKAKKANYLGVKRGKRWEEFHNQIMRYQKIEALIEPYLNKLSPRDKIDIYNANSFREAVQILKNKGFEKPQSLFKPKDKKGVEK